MVRAGHSRRATSGGQRGDLKPFTHKIADREKNPRAKKEKNKKFRFASGLDRQSLLKQEACGVLFGDDSGRAF